jgi:MoxR-like ATPase
MTQNNDISALRNWLNSQIIGQHHLVDRLLIALLANGHLLVEGAPGLAKTRAVKSLAQAIEGSFHRVQFTPDLLPGDVTGTDIYRPQEGNFVFQQGPIFNNIVLADEINRAPAKVQSALLEAMAERQVSVGRNTYQLSELFLVMATQNPIEQEGTYPLPEAQLDRFLMHVTVDYPSPADEKLILHLSRNEDLAGSEAEASCHISQASVFKARKDILKLHLAEPVEDYIVQLIVATRNAGKYDEALGALIEFGASPRGTIGLERCARAHAWLQGKDFVSPDDVRAVAHDVLSHRIILSFEAEASGVDSKQVIDRLLASVPVA